MKTSYIIGLLGLGALFTACSDDVPGKPNEVAPEDEINFTVNTSSVNSRTMYGEENADGTSQGLYWGNYNDWIADSIKIFSPNTRFSNANYLITPAAPNSNTAAGCTRLGEYGLQWGSNPDGLENFDFYGFYPASRCEDNVDYSGGKAVVEAWIRPGQSPVKFETSTSSGITTYSGNPDMRSCLMTAHTSAPYGADAVGFHFKPLATVLDVTIVGGLNMTDEPVFLVSLRSKSGKAIAGNFKVDMTTNTMVVENSDIEGSITNGQSEITMMPRNSTYDETTHLPTSTSTIALGQNDLMKVRFFLIPRSDLEISDLQVEVTTLTRVYTKTLTKTDLSTDYQTLKPSQIRKVTLPKLTEDGGRQFNVNFWLSQLVRNIYVTELSIPGAYNAASSTLSGYNKFQSVTAQKQFQSGVRAFKLNIFNDVTVKTSGSNTTITKTLCYGNSGTKPSSGTDNIKVGTVADLFTKLLSWMNDEKQKWEADANNEGKPFNDFVVLCLAPNRYYNGNANTNKFEQCYEISNALKTAISDFNAKNDNAVYTGPITPETTIADVAGKIIIHYNASTSVVEKTNQTGGIQQAETPETVNGVDALFSFWNAPTSVEYYSRPQLVNLTWGAPPAATTPVESVPAGSLGWLFYEFNGIGTATNAPTNYVTEDDMKTAIGNYGAISYANYVKGEHNIWGYLEIGGRYNNNNYSGQAQCTAMANTFNTYLYNYAASGQRTAAPWGIIMMNYADASSTEAVNAKSPELIRAIIANNRLFPLQRKEDAATDTSINNGGVVIAPSCWDMPKRR